MKELTARKISLAVLVAETVACFACALMIWANSLLRTEGNIISNNDVFMVALIFLIAGMIITSFKFKAIYYATMLLYFLGTVCGGCVLFFAIVVHAFTRNINDLISVVLMCFATAVLAIVALSPQFVYIFLHSKYVKKDNNEQ